MHRGVLWVEDWRSQSQTVQELETDCGERFVGSVQRALRSFCTTLSGSMDETLYKHIVQKTRSLFGDGAVQKSLQYLQAAFPRVILYGKDTAHTIRIATGDTVKRDAILSSRWADLMSASGLVHSVLSSDKLKHALGSCQHFFKDASGLQTVLKQIGFSDCRYESAAGSHRQFAALQGAITLMLALRCRDARVKVEDRHLAEFHPRALLASAVRISTRFGPEGLVSCGLFGCLNWRLGFGICVKLSLT